MSPLASVARTLIAHVAPLARVHVPNPVTRGASAGVLAHHASTVEASLAVGPVSGQPLVWQYDTAAALHWGIERSIWPVQAARTSKSAAALEATRAGAIMGGQTSAGIAQNATTTDDG